MAGGNLAAGIGIVLGVLAIVFFVEFMESEGQDTRDPPTGFEASFDIGTIQGAPTEVSGIYAFFVGGALVAGIVLVAAGVIGTLAGGG